MYVSRRECPLHPFKLSFDVYITAYQAASLRESIISTPAQWLVEPLRKWT